MSHEALKIAFQRGLNKTPEELFGRFEYQPIAAASIGQVHRAWTKQGRAVAVKIQYPDVVKAIKADFNNIDALKKVLTLVIRNSPNIDPLIEELRTSIVNECDYLQEAAWLDKFHQLAEKEFPDVIVPKPLIELSSSSILTMDFLQGDDFATSLQYERNVQDRLAQTALDFHMRCFYQHGLLHTDPQNGNYLFRRDGKMMVLDFGSVREFSMDFRKLYVALFRAIESDDVHRYRQALLNLQAFEESDTIELFRLHMSMVKKLYAPFQRQGQHRFETENPFSMAREFMKEIELKGRRAPRREFILLDRANLGLFTKLRAWRGEVDLYNAKENSFRHVESN
jgi:predicted unusual protein kinase regulating ubiquinone biosynthesis (AarF/ABC1/UbiB family)